MHFRAGTACERHGNEAERRDHRGHKNRTQPSPGTLGGGMVGASLARALAGCGMRIVVIEAWPLESASQPSYDDRAIALAYPARDLGWLPGGELGILITIVVASMVIGAAAIKPLGVQI